MINLHLTAETIQNDLSTQDWQIEAIQSAIVKADAEGTEFLDHEQVVTWFDRV